MNQQVVIENKRREDHGLNIALTRMVLRLQNTDRYYVQSESAENIYYIASYKFDEKNDYCSCPDSSIRRLKCKHQFAIEHSIRLGKIQTIDKFNGKTFANHIPVKQFCTVKELGYKGDEYSF